VRLLSSLAAAAVALAGVPTAAAHGSTATGGLSPVHGGLLVAVGLGIVGAAVALKRRGRLAPTPALAGALVGLTLAAVGAVLLDGLSPDPGYTASSMPFPRSWYRSLALSVGMLIAVGSFTVGYLRWPTRPRYTGLGVLLGLWVSYPYLVPGIASQTHPLGYAIVLATPLLVGYVLWKDAGEVLAAALRDPVARRFGIGVGVLVMLFVVTITGYVTLFPDDDMPHQLTVAVLPAVYQLVAWPTLEVLLPHVPFFLAVSPGQLIIVGLLSALVGLNAALIARHWRVQERAGMTQGTVGGAAIVGTCTCGCCGPLVAKVAVLAAGPSVAAPLYWVFVDSASPLSALFIVASVVLFTGTIVYAVETARGDDSSSLVTATPGGDPGDAD
jgi:hypothetical protein